MCGSFFEEILFIAKLAYSCLTRRTVQMLCEFPGFPEDGLQINYLLVTKQAFLKYRNAEGVGLCHWSTILLKILWRHYSKCLEELNTLQKLVTLLRSYYFHEQKSALSRPFSFQFCGSAKQNLSCVGKTNMNWLTYKPVSLKRWVLFFYKKYNEGFLLVCSS